MDSAAASSLFSPATGLRRDYMDSDSSSSALDMLAEEAVKRIPPPDNQHPPEPEKHLHARRVTKRPRKIEPNEAQTVGLFIRNILHFDNKDDYPEFDLSAMTAHFARYVRVFNIEPAMEVIGVRDSDTSVTQAILCDWLMDSQYDQVPGINYVRRRIIEAEETSDQPVRQTKHKKQEYPNDTLQSIESNSETQKIVKQAISELLAGSNPCEAAKAIQPSYSHRWKNYTSLNTSLKRWITGLDAEACLGFSKEEIVKVQKVCSTRAKGSKRRSPQT